MQLNKLSLKKTFRVMQSRWVNENKPSHNFPLNPVLHLQR